MNVLLDTISRYGHFLEQHRIRKRLAAILEDPANHWKTMVLAQRGKIDVGPAPDFWIQQPLAKNFTTESPLTHEIALQSRLIDLPHRDPADRFIVGTALVNGFAFATADEHLLRFRSIRTLPNR